MVKKVLRQEQNLVCNDLIISICYGFGIMKTSYATKRNTYTSSFFFFPLVFFFVNSSQKAEFALVGLKSRHIELEIS